MDEWAWLLGTGFVSSRSDEVRPARASGARDVEAKFREELHALSSLSFRVAYSVLRNRCDAEEVAQESLLGAHQKLSSLRNEDALRGWLVRITWRRALDRRRADARRELREAEASAATSQESPEEKVSREEMKRHLWAAIDTLPERLRRTLVLAAIEEYDLKVVAELLETPVGTVKSRLHAARKMLLEKMRWIAEKP